jgi:hypothetical protein
MICGLILDSIARSRLEQKRIWYMTHSAVDSGAKCNGSSKPDFDVLACPKIL